MFSGQGSQYPLMGLDFINLESNKNKIKTANQILGFDVKKALKNINGELEQTKYVQPLMVLVSMLIYDEFKKNHHIDGLTGFSLGEYTALYAAGIYDFETTLKLVKKRSELMEEASINYPGKMAAVLNFDLEKLNKIVNKINNDNDKIVTIANYNSKKQFVISGNEMGINETIKLLKEENVRRIIPLNVSGGFHSKLMYKPSEKLYEYLITLTKTKNKIPIYMNTTADKLIFEKLENELQRQMYSSVYFYQSIEKMIKDGYNTFIEIGPGKVLSNLVKRNYNNINVYNIEYYNDLKKWEEI